MLVDAEPAPAFRQAVVHHLRGLSHECLRILDAVAVLGPRFSIHEAAGLLGRNPVELLPLIGELIAASVLEDEGPCLSFRHPLVRETLYDRLSGPSRTALHREAAATLWREGRSAPTFLEHLMLGRRSDGDGLTPAAPHQEARFVPPAGQVALAARRTAASTAPPSAPSAPYAELMYRTTLRYSAAQVQGLHG
ncbi:hypothetical protein G3M58_25230, partial [Streptomyces sp. SID7499]|nr:hypothetical protein [Streptomyces sp. SID7499]